MTARLYRETITDARDRHAQLVRELGPGFDPLRLDEDDRAHVALLDLDALLQIARSGLILIAEDAEAARVQAELLVRQIDMATGRECEAGLRAMGPGEVGQVTSGTSRTEEPRRIS